MLAFWQGSAVVQSEPPSAFTPRFSTYINRPPVSRTARPGLAPPEEIGNPVDVDELPRIVIDLESADDAVTGGLSRHGACYIQITD